MISKIMATAVVAQICGRNSTGLNTLESGLLRIADDRRLHASIKLITVTGMNFTSQ